VLGCTALTFREFVPFNRGAASTVIEIPERIVPIT
jgi:hypothetical protein